MKNVRLSLPSQHLDGAYSEPVIPTPVIEDVATLFGHDVRPPYEQDGNFRTDLRIARLNVELVSTNPPTLRKADLDFIVVDQQSNPDAVLTSRDEEMAARIEYVRGWREHGRLRREPAVMAIERAWAHRDTDTMESYAVVFRDAMRPSLLHHLNMHAVNKQNRVALLPFGVLAAQQWEGHWALISEQDEDYGELRRVMHTAAAEADRTGRLRTK